MIESRKFRENPSVFVISKDNSFSIYSPLKNRILPVTKDELCLLENSDYPTKNVEIMNVFNSLGINAPSEQNDNKNYTSINALTFLPNNKCNFSCNYCYSASSRDNEEIDDLTIDIAIDYFIRNCRHNRFNVMILGGGEPFLSFPKVKNIMETAILTGKIHSKKVSFAITTNGSLVSTKLLEQLPDAPIFFSVSFDIIPEIQNTARHNNSYQKVVQNIELLINNGYNVGCNTIITSANVNLMPETIEHLHKILPKIKSCKFEPVIAPNLPDDFFPHFLFGFWKAYNIAQSYGINLVTSFTKDLEHIKGRFCKGGISVAPNGDIMACPSVSSPNSGQIELYNLYHLGHVDKRNKTVDVNWGKMEKIFNSIHIEEDCESCFAKYACSGLCFHEALCRKNLKSLCDFKREYLFRLLNE